MPDASRSTEARIPTSPRTSRIGKEIVLPDQTFRWLLSRSARSLRLPLLGAILPWGAADSDEPDEAYRDIEVPAQGEERGRVDGDLPPRR